jgi:amino acid adenylation domain-containing protein
VLIVITASRSATDSFDSILERSNLTRRQLLIYVGQQLSGVLLYDAVLAIRLKGIDLGAFQRTFQTLFNSCDALRTIVEETDGVPYQRVRPPSPYSIPHVDLRDGNHPQAADAWIHQRCQSPFNLAQQLFDTALLKTPDGDYTWYLNLHHVIVDGWALEVLVQTFFELYGRARRGELPDVVLLPSFLEYVHRVRAGRCLPEYRAAQDHWRERLAMPAEMPCFYGHTRAGRSTSKRRLSIELGTELTGKLRALAGRDDVFVKSLEATITNVCAALLFAYAYRTGGSKRLALGVAFHNRVSEDQKQLVGLLMEVLPFVVTVNPDESFLSLVRSVNQDARGALRHRDYSVGNPVQAPVYDMFLNPIRTIQLEEGQGPARRVFPGYGETSLSLTVLDAATSNNLELCLDVRSDLLDWVGGETMAGHFRTLLEAAISKPDQRISRLPLITETERHLLMQWNQTSVAGPSEQCVHQMFETQASRSPGAVAVVCGAQHLTYEALNRRANQLAHHLRKLGVGPETLVGICMTRGLDLVVALLGILKAGGAYVPLDPAYPFDRLAYMLEDTRVPLVLTQADLRAHVSRPGRRIVCVDVERAIIAEECKEDPACDVAGHNLAYVIYTSGSTGRPKGVMIAHRGVCNYLHWRRAYFPLTEADAFLQTASIGFDDSVWEIFEPLSTGARLVLVDTGREHDIPCLVQLIKRHQITAVCFVPSLLQAFLEDTDVEACRHLARVTTGGETLSAELEEQFFSRLPAARLYNGYGPTEATISATFWRCGPGSRRRVVPIGRPIANMRVHVLDHDLQMAPVGMPGELYIGGAGLARGYLNQPQLTAERFVPDPYGGEPASMLYRTGDLGRWVPDGHLEFLGRLDHQVKLRGFRIEPGEIEAALRQHPAVRDAVVALRDDTPGGKRLVAYVVTRLGAAPSVSDLHGFLGRMLPRHMVPAAFVVLDRLPLAPNGKVNRAALPAPNPGRPALEHAFATPGTRVEERLAAIWAEVLGLEQVGIHDNFFELGGHSLLAVRLFAKIEEAFGRKLALSTLLSGGTIKDLADALQSEQSPGPQESIVAIQPHGGRRPLFLLPSITGDLLFWREVGRHLGADQPCYGLQLRRSDGSAALFSRLTDMAARCVNQLQRAQPHGPYALAGFSFGGKLAFEMAQQLVAQGEEVSFLAIGDTGVVTHRPEWARRTLSTVASFLRNSAWWVWDDLLRSSPTQLGLRARRVVRSLVRKLRPARGGAGSGARDSRPEDIWEMDRVSESMRRVIDTHFRALLDYVPQRYPGRVTLFRARTQPLFHPGDGPDLGWGALCAGGVRVEVIPGNHETILHQPNVRVLAERLRACMGR